jgi:hypothetical protein
MRWIRWSNLDDNERLKRSRRLEYRARQIFLVVAPVVYFKIFLTSSKGQTRSASGIWAVGIIALFYLALMIWAVLGRRSLSMVIQMVVLGTVWLFLIFTTIYWNIGTAKNFGHPLSHLDSAYFFLGILSTAGTGAINPVSEQAQLVVSLQYVADIVFVGLVLALFIVRVTEWRRSLPTGGPAVVKPEPNTKVDGSEVTVILPERDSN